MRASTNCFLNYDGNRKRNWKDNMPFGEAWRIRQLDKIRQAAAARGGKCLSGHYEHCQALMTFTCAVHGRFKMEARRVVAGGWCDRCRRESRTPAVVERLLAYITQHGGKLKSPYVNAKTHVTIECSEHGDWRAIPDNLLNKGSWCLRCARSQPRPGRRKRRGGSVPILV